MNIIKISKSLEKLVNFSKLFKVVPPGMQIKNISFRMNIFTIFLVTGFSFFLFIPAADAVTCENNTPGLPWSCKAASLCDRATSSVETQFTCPIARQSCCLDTSSPHAEVTNCGNGGTCVLPNTCEGQILGSNNTCQTNTTSGKKVCCGAANTFNCSGQCDNVACTTPGTGKVAATGTCPIGEYCCQPAAATDPANTSGPGTPP